MKIQILGTGCPKCRTLYQNACEAVRDLGLEAEVIKVEDIMEITDFGVMMTPALAIDGDVKNVGKVLSAEEIKSIIG
ncbi:MAG: thioredoxin family protein [Deltaproteobacteria bacterium]|nr:thioredoxin family protein [Deltaproteobacteria bacterium]